MGREDVLTGNVTYLKLQKLHGCRRRGGRSLLFACYIDRLLRYLESCSSLVTKELLLVFESLKYFCVLNNLRS